MTQYERLLVQLLTSLSYSESFWELTTFSDSNSAFPLLCAAGVMHLCSGLLHKLMRLWGVAAALCVDVSH